jgi:hypothetical protein
MIPGALRRAVEYGHCGVRAAMPGLFAGVARSRPAGITGGGQRSNPSATPPQPPSQRKEQHEGSDQPGPGHDAACGHCGELCVLECKQRLLLAMQLVQLRDTGLQFLELRTARCPFRSRSFGSGVESVSVPGGPGAQLRHSQTLDLIGCRR